MLSRRRFVSSFLYLGIFGPAASGWFNARAAVVTSSPPDPAYLELHRRGELKKRGEELWERMSHCDLCPRECGVNRLQGERGICQATSRLEISSYHPHFGEEDPLVGEGGSGTIFLTNCSLRCVFCINWEISQGGSGYARSTEEMAEMMMELQKKGCHNINVVTPTHY
ncbi:MAG: radical SAM protein, partial [Candidatus Krumholzibacteriota bacterium]|nr:radical SAM protein [Candidatus Krumholzibacteriota bacterium]